MKGKIGWQVPKEFWLFSIIFNCFFCKKCFVWIYLDIRVKYLLCTLNCSSHRHHGNNATLPPISDADEPDSRADRTPVQLVSPVKDSPDFGGVYVGGAPPPVFPRKGAKKPATSENHIAKVEMHDNSSARSNGPSQRAFAIENDAGSVMMERSTSTPFPAAAGPDKELRSIMKQNNSINHRAASLPTPVDEIPSSISDADALGLWRDFVQSINQSINQSNDRSITWTFFNQSINRLISVVCTYIMFFLPDLIEVSSPPTEIRSVKPTAASSNHIAPGLPKHQLTADSTPDTKRANLRCDVIASL